MRLLLPVTVLLGAALPVVGALWLASLLLGRGPVAAVGPLVLSAALNALWPLGGGNVVAGTLRLRLGRREWTLDADRNPWRGRFGAVAMAVLTTGGFVAGVPLLALALRTVPVRSGLDTAVSWAGVAALLLVGWRTYRAELPLRHRVAELERWKAEGQAPDQARLAQWVRELATLARPDGSVGHVGGIGALTPGLHEVLDAEQLLRSAANLGVPEATRLHERCLEYLATQALPQGGFPAYPGGGGRVALTARAVEALWHRLTPSEQGVHRAFVLSCRSSSGTFGRSPGAPPSSADTRWAEQLLSTSQPGG